LKTILYLITIILTVSVFAQDKRVKIFPFKSAIIEYKYEASFKGTHVKYIDDYGYKQADYIRKSLNFGGNTDDEYETIILIGNKAYTMNLQDSTVAVGRNETYGYYLQNQDKSCVDVSEAILKAAEGWYLSGTKEFLGKECKVWKHTKHKKMTWQGLLVKSQINFMTMMVEKVTKIEINVEIPQNMFEIPKNFNFISSDSYQGFAGLKLKFDTTETALPKDGEVNHIKAEFNSGSLGSCNNFLYYTTEGKEIKSQGANSYNKVDNLIIKSQEQFLQNEKLNLPRFATLIFKNNENNFGKLQIKKMDNSDYEFRYVVFESNGNIKAYSDGIKDALSKDFIITADDDNNKLIVTPKDKAKCLIIGL